MRLPPLPPSDRYRPDERPPPGAVTAVCGLAFALAVLASLSPLAAISGLFAAACAVAVRKRR